MGTKMSKKPQAGGVLADRTVAFLTGAGGARQTAALRPWEAVVSVGGRAVLVHPDEDEARLFGQFGTDGEPPLERKVSEVHVEDYDALILSGPPDADDPLFQTSDAMRMATAFYLARKPIAALATLDGVAGGPGGRDIDPNLLRQRQQLRARALLELRRGGEALAILADDNSVDADQLRADNY